MFEGQDTNMHVDRPSQDVLMAKARKFCVQVIIFQLPACP